MPWLAAGTDAGAGGAGAGSTGVSATSSTWAFSAESGREGVSPRPLQRIMRRRTAHRKPKDKPDDLERAQQEEIQAQQQSDKDASAQHKRLAERSEALAQRQRQPGARVPPRSGNGE